ncbi:hypothetical protein MAHJHV45_47360 [Mycobacterium avium subsp. hominissuis]
MGTVSAKPAAATIRRAPRRVWATVMTVLIGVLTTVAHTRRGARRMVAAASAPHDPNTRDSADVMAVAG